MDSENVNKKMVIQNKNSGQQFNYDFYCIAIRKKKNSEKLSRLGSLLFYSNFLLLSNSFAHTAKLQASAQLNMFAYSILQFSLLFLFFCCRTRQQLVWFLMARNAKQGSYLKAYILEGLGSIGWSSGQQGCKVCSRTDRFCVYSGTADVIADRLWSVLAFCLNELPDQNIPYKEFLILSATEWLLGAHPLVSRRNRFHSLFVSFLNSHYFKSHLQNEQ